MIEIGGNNIFRANTYDYGKWSAPVMQMPEEVMQFLGNAAIAGRTISHVYSVGPAYNYSKEWLDNFAMAYSKENSTEDNMIAPFIAAIPEEVEFQRLMLVDKPFVLEFDTGDRLEILFDRGSEVRMSLNKLPKTLHSESEQTVDVELLFSEILGKRITGIQVGRRKTLPDDWEKPQGEDWKYQDSLIAYIAFTTDGDAALCFEPYKQTGRIFLMGKDKKIRPIKFGELQDGLTLEIFDPEMKKIFNNNMIKNLQQFENM